MYIKYVQSIWSYGEFSDWKSTSFFILLNKYIIQSYYICVTFFFLYFYMFFNRNWNFYNSFMSVSESIYLYLILLHWPIDTHFCMSLGSELCM